MDIRPHLIPPDGFRGDDGMPFRGALVQHPDGGGPSALTWAIFALLLLLLLLAVASLVVDLYSRRRDARAAATAPSAPTEPTVALATLDDRYARGEIPRDDYLRTRDDLRGATDATTQVIPPPEPEPA